MTIRRAVPAQPGDRVLRIESWAGLAVAAFASFSLLAPSATAAAAGHLDRSFGARGVVRTDFGARNPAVRAVAIDSEGRLVAAGETALARYMPDGSLDRSFSRDGKRRIGLQAFSMAIDSRGRIVVAGIRNPTRDDPEFALARYNADGSLDTSFGTNGEVTTSFGAGNADYARSIAIDHTGRLVVGGFTGTPVCNPRSCPLEYDVALARLRSNGTLDDSFGRNGKVTSDFGSPDERGDAIAIDGRGRIVLAGASTRDDSGIDRFLIARYEPGGSLDPAFSGDGFVTTRFPGAGDPTPATDNFALAFAVTIGPHGRVVAAGTAGTARCGSSCTVRSDFVLARYGADGSLDSSFSSGGRKTTDFRDRDSASAVQVDSRGRIVAVGSAFNASADHPTFALARYTRHGRLDGAFSRNGKTRKPHGFAYAMTIDPRDRIVAGGKSAGKLTLARYLAGRRGR